MPSGFDLQAYRFRELRAELEYDAAAEAVQAQEIRDFMDPFPLQAEAFDTIVHAIDNNEGAIFFLSMGLGILANHSFLKPFCTMFADWMKLQWLVLGMA